MLQIAVKFPFRTGNSPFYPLCVCLTPSPNFSITNDTQCQSVSGISAPYGCSYTPPIYVPYIYLMSVILFVGTFVLILLLREVKRTPFFPTKARAVLFWIIILRKCFWILSFFNDRPGLMYLIQNCCCPSFFLILRYLINVKFKLVECLLSFKSYYIILYNYFFYCQILESNFTFLFISI